MEPLARCKLVCIFLGFCVFAVATVLSFPYENEVNRKMQTGFNRRQSSKPYYSPSRGDNVASATGMYVSISLSE